MEDYISKQTAQAVFVSRMNKEIPSFLNQAVEDIRQAEVAMTMELRTAGKDLYNQANNLLGDKDLASRRQMVLQTADGAPVNGAYFRSTQKISFSADDEALVLKDNLILNESEEPIWDGVIVELRAWTRRKDLFHVRKDGTVLMLGRPATEEEIENGLEVIEFIRESLLEHQPGKRLQKTKPSQPSM